MNDFPLNDDGCSRVQQVLRESGAAGGWEPIAPHVASCPRCIAALARLTEAVNEQFAVSLLLDEIGLEGEGQAPGVDAPAGTAVREPLPFTPRDSARPGRRRGVRPRLLAALGGLAVAAALLLSVLIVVRPGGGGSAAADRRPQFVPSLQVLPARADNVYYAGEDVQVCLSINQPSRVVLSVLEGQTTFTLYDADSDPGSHCFPERITSALRTRAVLRTEVFYGSERVARQDVVLLPAPPTP